MTCEFAHRTNSYPPIHGNCYSGTAARRVTIQYSELEKDTLILCVSCAKTVTRDARRHGYKVTNHKLG